MCKWAAAKFPRKIKFPLLVSKQRVTSLRFTELGGAGTWPFIRVHSNCGIWLEAQDRRDGTSCRELVSQEMWGELNGAVPLVLEDGCVILGTPSPTLTVRYNIWSCFSEIAQVIASYTATGPEQLTLAPGQLILIRKKNPGGWWEGELQVSVSVYVKISVQAKFAKSQGTVYHCKIQRVSLSGPAPVEGLLCLLCLVLRAENA